MSYLTLRGGLGFNFGMYILLTMGSIMALAYIHPETPRAQVRNSKQELAWSDFALKLFNDL
jgi:hypothetical protein